MDYSEQQFADFADEMSPRSESLLHEFIESHPEFENLFTIDNPNAAINIGKLLVESSTMPQCQSALEISLERLIERRELLKPDSTPARKFVAVPPPPEPLDRDFYNLAGMLSQREINAIFAGEDPEPVPDFCRRYNLLCTLHPGR
jgi:hypothetical protein